MDAEDRGAAEAGGAACGASGGAAGNGVPGQASHSPSADFKTAPIAFSRGCGKFDNTPEQRLASSFDAFADMVLLDRSKKKGEVWIAGPFAVAGHDEHNQQSHAMYRAIGKPHRCAVCALHRSFIGLDLDGGLDAEGLLFLFEELPSKGWSYFAYSTASSTPEGPRCRIVLELDQAADRPSIIKASRAVRNLLSEAVHDQTGQSPKWDAACDRPEQPLYGPVDAPALWVKKEIGRPLKLSWLLSLPVGAPDKLPLANTPAIGMPVSQQTVTELRSALAFMRADDRELWIRMGQALRPLGEIGRALWLDWSQTSEKWRPQDARTWDTFSGDRTGYEAVFAEAQRRGWVNPRSNAARIEPSSPAGSSARLKLRRAADVQCQPIGWLWRGYLARGKLHILAGAPGTGKTTITAAIASPLSRGGEWPDGTMAPIGNVLFWSGEDDIADTLAPRLMAAGADLSRVYFVDDIVDRGVTRSFDPATDLAALEQEASRIGDIGLLIVDPVVSAVVGDSHKNAEVRRALQPLVNLAARLDCAVLGVSHFSKGSSGRDPTERLIGSIAFGALPRVVLTTARGNDERKPRILTRAKSNIGPDGDGFEYHLEHESAGGIEASRVRWGEPLVGTARELLGNLEALKDKPLDGAVQFLRDQLSRGPKRASDVRGAADELGLSWRTVQNAKHELGVKSVRESNGNRGSGGWVWELPEEQPPARPQTQPVNVAPLPAASNGAGAGPPARAQGRKAAGSSSVAALPPFLQKADGGADAE